MDRRSPPRPTLFARLLSGPPRLAVGDAARVDALQYLRAFAALMVVIYHADHYLIDYRRGPELQGYMDGRLALHGVAIFFALSGYLMARLSERTSADRFLLHRIVRIYPIYFICAAAFCALSPIIIGNFYSPRLLATTLIPVGTASYPLGIEWTLVFEVTFYVFVCLVVWLGAARLIVPIALAWLAAIAGASLVLPASDLAAALPPIYLLPFNVANVAFACGLLVPWLVRHVRLPWVVALLPLPALAVSGYFGLPANRAIGGVTSALLVASALSWRVDRLPNPLHRVMLRLGDASYAIYLVHVPAIVGVYRWLPEATPLRAAWAIGCAGAIGVGLLAGSLDISLYRRLKRRVDGLAGPHARRLAVAFLVVFAAISAYGGATTFIERGEAARARAVIDRLGQVADGAAVAEILAADGSRFGDPAGQVDAVATLPDGRLAISGWALDRQAPKAVTYVAVFCEGRQIALARRARLRPEQAQALAMPGLRHVRIGFTLASDERHPCGDGSQPVVVAADVRGKAWVVPSR